MGLDRLGRRCDFAQRQRSRKNLDQYVHGDAENTLQIGWAFPMFYFRLLKIDRA
jgi:hypothetical protein